MNALELADLLKPDLPFVARKHAEQAATLLRKQDAAIKQLREALTNTIEDSIAVAIQYKITFGPHWRPHVYDVQRKKIADAEQALQDTEEFQ